MKCPVCNSNEAHEQLVDEVFQVDGRRALVTDIPALVCKQCGELTFSRETTERVRRLLHEAAEPVATMSIDVFSFDQELSVG
jgi:YgiT-type zinc finger domain-containing protein